MTTDVYEFLARIRPRPAMWLGVAKISVLKNFLDGFFYARRHYDPHAFEIPPFDLLHDWIALRFQGSLSAAGWSNILKEHCQGDETAALQLFFELLDEFRQIRVVRGLEIILGPGNHAFYHSAGCGIRSYNAGSMTEDNRVPAPDRVYLLQFAGLGYYAFLHRSDKSVWRDTHYHSLRTALERLHQQFGPMLHQKPVLELSPAALRAIMQPAAPDQQ